MRYWHTIKTDYEMTMKDVGLIVTALNRLIVTALNRLIAMALIKLRINIKIHPDLIKAMTNLTIPSLHLFNRSPSRKNSPIKYISPATTQYQSLKTHQRFHHPNNYPIAELEERDIRSQLHYQAGHSKFLTSAYLTSPPFLYPKSQQARNRTISEQNKHGTNICQCGQQGHHLIPQTNIVKNPYMNSKYGITQMYNNTGNDTSLREKNIEKNIPETFRKENSTTLKRDVYLSVNHHSNHALSKNLVRNIGDNQSKRHEEVNRSAIVNPIPQTLMNASHLTNKSLIINQEIKPQRIQKSSYQTQTQELVNRSSFLIEKVIKKVPQMMNEVNFKKAMKDYTKQINSIRLDLGSDDIIIDLSDLVETKEQYVEQSRELLVKLNELAEDKVEYSLINKLFNQNKKQEGIYWPQGV